MGSVTLLSEVLVLFSGLILLGFAKGSILRKNNLSVASITGVQTCDDPGVPKNGFRVGEDFGFKSSVEYFCNPGFRLAKGTRLRVCQENFKWDGSLPTCKDINECIEYEDLGTPYASNDVQLEHRHLCHFTATCYNTIGSFHCKCKPGYHGDGKFCVSDKLLMAGALLRMTAKTSPHTCGTLGDIGNSSTRIRRIVGGHLSSQGAWPWQVAIYYTGPRNERYLLNGALIKPGWVLTVAHVLQMKGKLIKPTKLKLVLGEHNRERLDGTEKTTSVRRIVSHPGYNRYTFSNNIALLELERRVKLNNHIRMVCVPKRKRDSVLENPPQYGTVAGWGSTKRIRIGDPTGPLSAELRQVTVPLVTDKECKKASIYTYDTDLTLCAGFKRKPKDPCFGDIGSPLVMQHPHSGKWTVIGLFGWSEGCGRPKKYAYYTRVSRYRKWINFVVKQRQ